ncbi:MAG: hypothetical protein CL676_09745 [Bdellovibrionaceae bacterium]|nr:hypothetical protein [Pseudobdellovibrionaceae bacterium]
MLVQVQSRAPNKKGPLRVLFYLVRETGLGEFFRPTDQAHVLPLRRRSSPLLSINRKLSTKE